MTIHTHIDFGYEPYDDVPIEPVVGAVLDATEYTPHAGGSCADCGEVLHHSGSRRLRVRITSVTDCCAWDHGCPECHGDGFTVTWEEIPLA